MKYLQNTITGEVLKLKTEPPVFLKFPTDSEDLNTSSQCINIENLENYIYEQVLLQLGSDWVYAEEPNWCITTGSTGQPTTVRVTIKKSLIGDVMYSGIALDQLIQMIEPLSIWAVSPEMYRVQYLEELLSPAKEILFGYVGNGIKIEKLVPEMIGENGNIIPKHIEEITSIENYDLIMKKITSNTASSTFVNDKKI